MFKMADNDDTEAKEYRWESGYEKTWEAIKEDEDGLLDTTINDVILKAKRKRLASKAENNRLGMMRHLYIIIDCSECMSVPDLKPTRLLCTVKLLKTFTEEYFDKNPISHLGFIVLRSKRAEKLSELNGSSKLQIKALDSLQKISLTGEPSLQNGLDLAWKSLKVVPAHTSREIVIIMGSLTTCDPCDINTTIDLLKTEGIRCSVISLSAEIHVCRLLTELTNGTFGSVLDDTHFRDQLMSHIDPPPATRSQENSLIKMGFPHATADDGKDPTLSMCMCHLDNGENPSKLTAGGLTCPQCSSKYCELPVECQTCDLTLVSAPHLARSYHHLFPVKNFTEITFNGQAGVCYACQKSLTMTGDKTVFRCETCLQIFCVDCDVFIHDILHSCVGCTTIPSVAQKLHTRKPQPPPPHGMSTLRI